MSPPPASDGNTHRVALVAKPSDPHTGVGRYVQALRAELGRAGASALVVAPTDLRLPDAVSTVLGRLRVDPRAFLMTYPVWASYPEAAIYHLTSQNLASLLVFHPPPGKVVVTVHDIIPFLLRRQPRLRSRWTVADRVFDRLAMAGLRRADLLIAVSHDTKRCLVEQLGIPAARIAVVWEGVDHDRFRPAPLLAGLHERYRLPIGPRYLIYVGSDDPRKDLPTLLRALARVRAELPDVALIKVGRAHVDRERRKLVDLTGELGLRSVVHFLDDVPEADLPPLYNLADVAVLPSRYEGFGLPALEALACGRPLVYARAGALPEVVDAAGIPFAPGQPDALARALVELLGNPERGHALSQQGQERAARFTWERTARETISLYARLSEETQLLAR